jgi:hypothetical protein
MGGFSSLDPVDGSVGMGSSSPASVALSGCGLDFGGCFDSRLLVEGRETPLALGEGLIFGVPRGSTQKSSYSIATRAFLLFPVTDWN